MSRKSMIAIISIIATGILILTIGVNMPTQQKKRAAESLGKYLTALNLTVVSQVCNKDSDGNGYASCSYNNGHEIVNLECDSAFIFNSGSCKRPKHMFSE